MENIFLSITSFFILSLLSIFILCLILFLIVMMLYIIDFIIDIRKLYKISITCLIFTVVFLISLYSVKLFEI